jgi:hypothetical protein
MTWVNRGFVTIIIGIIIMIVGFVNSINLLVTFSLMLLPLVVGLSLPKQDIGIDGKHLYVFYRSILPLFSKIKTFEISKIKTISCSGNYSKGSEIFEIISFSNIYQSVNSIKLVFKDESSAEINVDIYKKDLDKAVALVQRVI